MNKNVYEAAIALLNEMLDIMASIDNAPDRLFPQYLPGKERRLLKRRAERLRSGEARPRSENVFTAPQLARIYDHTVAANELRERTGPAFERNFNAMGVLIREDGLSVRQAIDDVFLDALTQAKRDGPGSKADRRYQRLQFFAGFTRTVHTDVRRDKPSDSRAPRSQPERNALVPLVPAEIIASVPPGEAVIPIPADGDSARERILIRIGDEGRSWIGSFERGLKTVSTVFMLPDRKNIFVSAEGAGYVVDAKSRTLVERTGSEVVGTMRDRLLTLFVVNHNGVAFEAFGKDGRLWKTTPISDRPLRNVVLTDDGIAGEAWKFLAQRWMPFLVSATTGEVSVGLGL
ncbi:MAG TPA: hypothetical protein VGJ88_00240 [Thermoanaerobaculia bacterium]